MAANTQTAGEAGHATLRRGEIGLLGVLMPGLAQVAPAFNLFFTTGLMAAFAGASVPLVFLISMVGLIATAASLALFSGVFPSAGSFLTYIARSMGARTSVVVGVITLLGYIIAFGGIYIFVGQYIVQNVFNSPHIWGDLRPGQPAPYSYLPWLTIALIAAGIIYMLALRAVRPRAMDQAVSLLEGEVEAASPAL
jgi:amino acid transporter